MIFRIEIKDVITVRSNGQITDFAKGRIGPDEDGLMSVLAGVSWNLPTTEISVDHPGRPVHP